LIIKEKNHNEYMIEKGSKGLLWAGRKESERVVFIERGKKAYLITLYFIKGKKGGGILKRRVRFDRYWKKGKVKQHGVEKRRGYTGTYKGKEKEKILFPRYLGGGKKEDVSQSIFSRGGKDNMPYAPTQKKKKKKKMKTGTPALEGGKEGGGEGRDLAHTKVLLATYKKGREKGKRGGHECRHQSGKGIKEERDWEPTVSATVRRKKRKDLSQKRGGENCR